MRAARRTVNGTGAGQRRTSWTQLRLDGYRDGERAAILLRLVRSRSGAGFRGRNLAPGTAAGAAMPLILRHRDGDADDVQGGKRHPAIEACAVRDVERA